MFRLSRWQKGFMGSQTASSPRFAILLYVFTYHFIIETVQRENLDKCNSGLRDL